MTDTNNTAAPSSKAPAYHAYHVRDGKDKGFFTKIGAAWPHKDGKGFNIQIDMVPLDGKIALRAMSETKE